MKKLFYSFLILASLRTFAATEGISTNSKDQLDVHEQRRFGVMVGIGSPFPSIFGTTAAYHINKDIRATLGYGEVSVTTSVAFTENGFESKSVKATTYDAGGEYLFSDGRFRPLIGGHIAYFKKSGDGDISLQGFNKSGAYMYTNVGFDFLAFNGYQIGMGYDIGLVGTSNSSFYINTGYYF